MTNETILSGDIGSAGNSDNSYHVVVSAGVDSTAILDGFTVSDGNADGTDSEHKSGAGFASCVTSGASCPDTDNDATIRNCVFKDNDAENAAAGMHIRGNSEVSNCTFKDNTVTGWISAHSGAI